MNESIEVALEAFQCGNNRQGEEVLTNYMSEHVCTDHISVVADRVFRLFNEKSKESKAQLLLDLVYAPKNAVMMAGTGGMTKAGSAEFRLFSLDESGGITGVKHEFVVRYRQFVPLSGQVCRCLH